jgi:hypothetical protein
MITIDQAEFFSNLRLTQAYCEQEMQREEKVDMCILRSIINPIWKDGKWFAHMPSLDGMASIEQSIPWEEWTKKSDPYYLESFIGIFKRQLAFKKALSDKLTHNDIYKGKILVVEYGENIPDGAAEPETDGFFDEWDIPPIDTWFYNDYSVARGGILLAWIPERFVELADKAIEVQVLNILNWFEKPRDWVA